MSPQAAAREGRTAAPFSGWHALACFVGFFAFMFAVNGIFLWTAIKTFPGEDVEKSYLTGLDYNQELERKSLQAAAGWSAEIGLSGKSADRSIEIRLKQRDGTGLPASAAQLLLRHPTDRAYDQMVVLSAEGDGVFRGSIVSLTRGVWRADFSADVDPAAPGNEFKASRDLVVP